MFNFTRIPSNIKSLQMLKKFVNCKNFLQLILILITHAPVVFRLGLWPGMPLYRTVSDRGLWKKNRTKEVRDHLIVLTLTSRPPISVFLSNLSSPTSFLCSPQNLPRTLHLSTSTSQTTSTSHVRRSPTHRYARVTLNKSKLGPLNLEKQKNLTMSLLARPWSRIPLQLKAEHSRHQQGHRRRQQKVRRRLQRRFCATCFACQVLSQHPAGSHPNFHAIPGCPEPVRS